MFNIHVKFTIVRHFKNTWLCYYCIVSIVKRRVKNEILTTLHTTYRGKVLHDFSSWFTLTSHQTTADLLTTGGLQST